MNKLSAYLNILKSKIPESEKLNLAVSKSSVGWHIEHTILATIKIIEALKKSNPAEYKWEFNLSRLYVYSINKIPRGRGKAPKSVLPADEITAETLKSSIVIAKIKIEELNNLNPNNYFVHPYFGKLNLKHTIKFLNIHARHHIKIIEDIAAK